MDGRKNEERRVDGGWDLYGERIQRKAGLGKIATLWDGEIKGIAEALTSQNKSSKTIFPSGYGCVKKGREDEKGKNK